MSSMFSNCTSLQKIKFIPDKGNVTFVTNGVTTMRYMFVNDYHLTELDFNKFITSKVTTMYGMFQNCYLVKTLDLSNFDMTKVIDVGKMFVSFAASVSGCI